MTLTLGKKAFWSVSIDYKSVNKRICTSYHLLIPQFENWQVLSSLTGGAPCVLWRKCHLDHMNRDQISLGNTCGYLPLPNPPSAAFSYMHSHVDFFG